MGRRHQLQHECEAMLLHQRRQHLQHQMRIRIVGLMKVVHQCRRAGQTPSCGGQRKTQRAQCAAGNQFADGTGG